MIKISDADAIAGQIGPAHQPFVLPGSVICPPFDLAY
jgi:hypothetical protein